MRSLIVAVLLGLTGGLVAYVRFDGVHRGKIDSLEGPLDRMARIMKIKGISFTELDESPRPQINHKTDPNFNFGTMSRHSKKSHTFVIKNEGNAASKIELAGSTCKCTIGELNKQELAPGEEAEIVLTWTAETEDREFGQSATIKTDDPVNSELKFTVTGKVENRIFIESDDMALGDVDSTQSIKRKFLIFSDYDTPLEISNLQWRDKGTANLVKFEHTVRPVSKREFPDTDAQYVAEVSVEISPGLPDGPLETPILFHTNVETEKDGKPKPFQIYTLGRVQSRFRVIAGGNFNQTLNILEIGKVPSSKGTIQKFLISVTDEHPENLKLSAEEIRPEETITIRIGEPTLKEDRAIFPIELEVPKGAAPVYYYGTNQSNFGRVMFRTNQEFSNRLALYLKVEVEDK